MQRINPLGSTVSITRMLYCIYRLILLLGGTQKTLWGPRAIGDHGAPVSFPNSKKP
ncbi:unnamed protein product, partial [Staurois parvus]